MIFDETFPCLIFLTLTDLLYLSIHTVYKASALCKNPSLYKQATGIPCVYVPYLIGSHYLYI